MKKAKNTTNLHIFAATLLIIGCTSVAGGLLARSTSLRIRAKYQAGDLSAQRVMIHAGIFSEKQLETEKEKILFAGMLGSQTQCIRLGNLLVDMSASWLVLGLIHLFLGATFARFVGKLKKQIGKDVLDGLSGQAKSLGTIPQNTLADKEKR